MKMTNKIVKRRQKVRQTNIFSVFTRGVSRRYSHRSYRYKEGLVIRCGRLLPELCHIQLCLWSIQVPFL